MARYRIGNDMTVLWTVNDRDGKALPLQDKEVHLYYTCERGRFEADIEIQDDNVVIWHFFGRQQRTLGNYTLTLEILQSNGKRTIKKDLCRAFTLVGKECEEKYDRSGAHINEGGEITLASDLDIYRIQPIIPQIVEDENGIGYWHVDGVNTGVRSTGKSAYEIAVEFGGFNGTEEEFGEYLASLAKETVYISENENKSLSMPSGVGGLAKGTKVSDLEGKTFSQMFDDILFPTVFPTFTSPTASIQFKNYTSTKEVGSTAPSASNFTTGYNAGAITLNGVKQNNRGGELDSDNSFIYVNGDANNRTLPTKVSLGSTTYKYRAAYGKGARPKDNKGNNYDAPLAAGYVDSSAITLNGTYPWFASTASASAENPVAKQSLVAWNATAGSMGTGNFELQPSGTLPQVFKLPRKINTLQMLNTVSNKMETIGLGDYNETTETINIGGVDVTYYVYTYKGAARGSVTLLATF